MPSCDKSSRASSSVSEINYDKVNKVRGMDIVIVTTSETDEEARELLSQLGMPFQK